MHRSKATICEIAIFMDNHEQIKKVCEYQILVDEAVPTVTRLNHGKFAMFKVDNYELQCGRGKPTTQTECALCVVVLAPSCEIVTPHVHIFRMWGDESVQRTVQRHAINRVMMSHFFSEAELRAISGDSLLTAPAVVDKLPVWKIHRSDTSDLLAQDEKLKLNLIKTVEAVKSDRDIVGSLADSIVIGTQQIPARWDWLDYFSIGLAILCGLLTVQITYVTVKLRTLSLLVAVMHQQILPSAEGQVTEPPGGFRLQYPTEIESVPRSTKDQYEEIMRSINSHWFWMVVSTVIVAVTAWIIWKKVSACVHKIHRMRIETTLAIQFCSGEQNLVVAIQKVYALMTDVSVECDEFLDTIRINGYIRPTLKFDWDARIKDAFTGVSIPVVNQVQLNPLEAYILRAVLLRRYTIEVVFQSEGKTTRMTLAGQQPMKGRVGGRKNDRGNQRLSRSVSMCTVPRSSEFLFENPLGKRQRKNEESPC
jgi:hypothetical protein